MTKFIRRKMIYFLIAVVLGIMLFLLYQKQVRQVKVSEFGKYRGYSEAIYDGNQRISNYLTLSNGTRLAYDIILPTKKGVPANKPLPVLFKYTPYLRTFTIFDLAGKNIIADLFNLGWKEKAYLRARYWFDKRGNLMDPVFRTKYLKTMLKHGYAVVVVERPGTGASFGVMNASFEVGAKEVNEILNWIAAQKWCDGNIGMYGDSFQAMIQFAAAATGNPHLKALFPTSSGFDMYSAVTYPGGILNKTFASFFSWSTSFLEHVVTPVDSDKDGLLLSQARKERSGSTLAKQSEVWFRKFPFRDSITSDGNKIWEGPGNLYPLLERINQSGIPVYMTTGWYDLFSGAGEFLWYANLTVPKRLLVRPADHSEVEKNQFDLDFGSEVHRWFDYWLKGIDNGIMGEPPIHYYVMGASKTDAWRTSTQWPLVNQKLTRFFFGEGKTSSVASINDGFLRTEPSGHKDAADTYTVDYSTTSGKYSRWYAVNWPRNYPNMRSNDEKALTYTTSPLETDVEVTGHPLIHLWLTTNAADLDTFVYLEEVDRSGKSIYLTEGNLRASHRKLSKAPYNNLALPYHSHYQSELEPIPAGKPVELVFSLLPISYRFHKGNHIRITVAFADTDNFETPVIDPAPKIHLLRDMNYHSSIQLPVVQRH